MAEAITGAAAKSTATIRDPQEVAVETVRAKKAAVSESSYRGIKDNQDVLDGGSLNCSYLHSSFVSEKLSELVPALRWIVLLAVEGLWTVPFRSKVSACFLKKYVYRGMGILARR